MTNSNASASSTASASSNASMAAATTENDAWRLVCDREGGTRYLSMYQISTQTGVHQRKVDAMVARYRAMRRAEVEIDRQDWWTARLTPMPLPTAAAH